MILYVVVLFALSWLPLYVAFSLIKFWPLSPDAEKRIVAFLPIAQWLGAANSSINPLLYAIFNQRFREGYKALLSGRICRAFDYGDSVRAWYFSGGRAAGTALKRKRSKRTPDMRNTIGAIYAHRRGVQPPDAKRKRAAAAGEPRSLSVREAVRDQESFADSVVQFRSTKCANAFV